MIQVTAAVIRNGDKVMICKRPKDKRLGGKWEFPGGKVEPGETLFDCIKRECMEELGITIEPKREITSIENENVCLHFIEAVIIKGDIKLKEHESAEWISKVDTDKFEFCPADKEALKHIL